MENQGVDPLQVSQIVVPLDGSDYAARALPVAQRLAAALGSELAIMYVADPDDTDADIRRAVGESSALVVVDNDVAGAIIHAAESQAGAVLCMSSHGRSRSAAVFGSVAAAVIARTSHPVVLVGPSTTNPYSAAGDVVVCVDGSEASEASLAPAAAWASALDSPLKIVTVIEPAPEPVAIHLTQHPGHWSAIVADDYVGRLASDWRRHGVHAASEVINDPISAVSGISEYVAAQPAALVAVATHQRTGMARAVFGSAAAGIVRRATAPVLVVPTRT